MDYDQALIDVLRATHLVCFAAGMGTGVYFDFRTFRTLGDPINLADIHSLERLHLWIFAAFCGLWVTGIALIYVRTAFDISSFSPKLWLKIGVMSLLVVNSLAISRVVIPVLRASVGSAMIALPTARLLIISQIAIISMYCWSSGLLLGSSVVLKHAHWQVLLPLAAMWLALLTVLGQMAVVLVRRRQPVSSEAS